MRRQEFKYFVRVLPMVSRQNRRLPSVLIDRLNSHRRGRDSTSKTGNVPVSILPLPILNEIYPPSNENIYPLNLLAEKKLLYFLFALRYFYIIYYSQDSPATF